MKLFAKRTKKVITAEEATALALVSEADKAALELLKKDQSTLNAKQRRMIKRYEERKEENAINDTASGETNGSKLTNVENFTDKEAAITDTSPETSDEIEANREGLTELDVSDSDTSDSERRNACGDETPRPPAKKENFEKSKKLVDRKSTRLNSSHPSISRMPSSA